MLSKVGGIAGQYGIWCPIWWKGMCMVRGSSTPFLDSLLANFSYNYFVGGIFYFIHDVCY